MSEPALSSLAPPPGLGGRPPPTAVRTRPSMPLLGRSVGRSNSAPTSDSPPIAKPPVACNSNANNATPPPALPTASAAAVDDKKGTSDDKGRPANDAALRGLESAAERCRNGLLAPSDRKHGRKHQEPPQRPGVARARRRSVVKCPPPPPLQTTTARSVLTPPRTTNELRVRLPLQYDANDVPLIDRPITPPGSPLAARTSSYRVFPPRRLTAGRAPLTRHGSLLQQRRPQRRHPGHESPPEFDASARNPTITITMNEDDNDSDDDDDRFDDITNDDDDRDDDFIDDYLKPDDEQVNLTNNSHMQFIGDNASLFGMTKDEAIGIEIEPTKSGTSTTNYLKDQLVAFFQPSDNKLAMKLFGNRNALIKEKMRQKATGNWVIHPCSDFR